MAISVLQSNAARTASANPATLSFTSPVTAGNLLVLGAIIDSSATFVSVSDNINGVWVAIGTAQFQNQNPGSTRIYYFDNSLAGTVTVSLNMSVASASDMFLYEIAGAAKASPLDQQAGVSPATQNVTASSGNITTTSSNEILIGVCSSQGSVTGGEAGWTTVINGGSGNAAEYIIVSSVGTYAATFTQASSLFYAVSIASFKTSTSQFPLSADSFKLIPSPSTTPTNLSDASDDTLSTRLQQHSDGIVSVENWLLSTVKGRGGINTASDTGTTNNYVVSLNPPLPAYSDGVTILFTTSNANTGPSTLAADSLAPVNILTPAGNPLQGAEIIPNRQVLVTFLSPNFRIISTCSLALNFGNVTSNPSVECAGYSSVSVAFGVNTIFSPTLTLNHVGMGTAVTIYTANSSSSAVTIKWAATDASGVALSAGILAKFSNASSATNMTTTGLNTAGNGWVLIASGHRINNSIIMVGN